MASKLTHNFATAPDGAKLSYYTTGTGPGIIVVHGAMSFGLTHKDLAVALSPYFTVHLISRRARGLSGPYPPSITSSSSPLCTSKTNPPETLRIANRTLPRTYTPSFSSTVLETDVSDLHTLLTATGARFIVSISSGALITLSYLLTYPGAAGLIEKAILFEPPVQFSDLDKPNSQLKGFASLGAYETRREAGDNIGALVSALRMTGMVPGWMPGWLVGVIVKRKGEAHRSRALAKQREGSEQSRGEGDGVSGPLDLVQALRYDFCVGEAMVGDAERFKGIQGVKVLLMGGTKSQGYLREAMDVLEGLLGCEKVVIQGLAHVGLSNEEAGGRPEAAAGAIRSFLDS
ncbi:hypothetical protein OQA88_2965 [Cercophora sp. LCS_1]